MISVCGSGTMTDRGHDGEAVGRLPATWRRSTGHQFEQIRRSAIATEESSAATERLNQAEMPGRGIRAATTAWNINPRRHGFHYRTTLARPTSSGTPGGAGLRTQKPRNLQLNGVEHIVPIRRGPAAEPAHHGQSLSATTACHWSSVGLGAQPTGLRGLESPGEWGTR